MILKEIIKALKKQVATNTTLKDIMKFELEELLKSQEMIPQTQNANITRPIPISRSPDKAAIIESTTPPSSFPDLHRVNSPKKLSESFGEMYRSDTVRINNTPEKGSSPNLKTNMSEQIRR